MRRPAPLVLLLLVAGCGEEKRPPMLAGGREVSSWVAAIRDPKPSVRRQAVLKLGNVGDADPLAAPALLGALSDREALVRHDAVLAVFKLKDPSPDAYSRLATMSKSDPDPRAREAAAKFLATRPPAN